MDKMKKNIFQNARVKLTAYYVGVMLVILGVFTVALIYAVDYNINQNLTGGVITENQEGGIEKTEDMIEFSIYCIDAILLFIIGYFSYFLSGRTLQPIAQSHENQKKFYENISHHLRTPVATIITQSEVAIDDSFSNEKKLRDVIKSNLEEARVVSKLVNDMLMGSRGK